MKFNLEVFVSFIAIIFICAVILVGLYKAHTMYSISKRRRVPFKTRMRIFNELLSIIYQSAKQSNTKPFLLYGTLLGQVRQDDFIPYDFDVDVGIMHDEYDKIRSHLIQTIPKHNQYRLKEKKLFQCRSMVIYDSETGINADIFEFVKNGDKNCIESN